MIELNTYITERIGFYAPDRTDGGAAILETIHRRDFANLEPQAVLIIVGQVITYLITRQGTLGIQETRLQARQPVDASAYYRRHNRGAKRYLYLNHRIQDNRPRKREYIGADPGRQAAALDRIDAYEELVKVQAEIREVSNRLAAITGHLSRALLAATMGLDRVW
jgi:hypothetical protein